MINADSPENYDNYLWVYRGSWKELLKLVPPKERWAILEAVNETGLCSIIPYLRNLLILFFSDLKTSSSITSFIIFPSELST